MGRKAIAYLHYFAGGEYNAYITEKDKGSPDDHPQLKGMQQQAYGLACPFLSDDGETGYISIQEIIENNGELDFHWTPQTLEQIVEERNKDDEAEAEVLRIESQQQ